MNILIKKKQNVEMRKINMKKLRIIVDLFNKRNDHVICFVRYKIFREKHLHSEIGLFVQNYSSNEKII